MSKCQHCIVRRFNSFNSLTKEELIKISSCKTTRKIKKGETLFEEGERINGIYCIKEGVCKISKMSENGRNQILNLLKHGDLLGQRSLVSDEVSNLKAVALNDMKVCFIPKEEILSDLEKNPDFTFSILKDMATSLKIADNVIVDMAQKTVKQRLAEILLKLYTVFHHKDEGIIDLQLSREEIANLIGTATESAIRLLSEFKKKNIIEFKGKNIVILNKLELEKIVQGF